MRIFGIGRRLDGGGSKAAAAARRRTGLQSNSMHLRGGDVATAAAGLREVVGELERLRDEMGQAAAAAGEEAEGAAALRRALGEAEARAERAATAAGASIAGLREGGAGRELALRSAEAGMVGSLLWCSEHMLQIRSNAWKGGDAVRCCGVSKGM